MPTASNLLGRDDELRAATQLLEEFGFVSIVGLPGIGKTALANALASAEGIQVAFCRPQSRVRELLDVTDLGSLVVLDAVDQLCAAERLTLEEHCMGLPDVRWLFTTRERLGWGVEAVLQLGALDLEAATALLQQRLRRLGVPRCSGSQASDVARKMDCLPSALLVAANHIELVGIEALCSSDVDVLELSTNGLGLSSAYAASLAMASDRERHATCACGAFVGAFDAEAFGIVSDASVDVLARLVSLGLLERNATNPPTFRIYTTLAEFARRREGGWRAACDRHAVWAVASGSRAERLAVGRRAVAGELTDAGLGLLALAMVAEPPMELLDGLIELGRKAELPGFVDLLIKRAEVAIRGSDSRLAASLAEEADAAADATTRSRVFELRASIARRTEHSAESLTFYEAALTGAAAQAIPRIRANRAGLLWESGRHAEARAEMEHALEQSRLAGDRRAEGVLMANLGVMLHNAGQLPAAEEMHKRALLLHRASANPRFEGITLFDLGLLYHETGALNAALTSQREALAMLDEYDSRLAGLTRASLAAIETRLGFEATYDVNELRATFLRAGDPVYAEAAELYGRLAETYRAVTLSPSVVKPIDLDFAHRTDEVQVPARLLSTSTRTLVAEGGLIVRFDRGAFRLNGATKDLSRRAAYRAIFALFVARRLDQDPPVTVSEIVEAGWPDEIIEADAAKNRAHVALSSLRKLGLSDVLHSYDGRYGIALETPIFVAASEDTPTKDDHG